MNVGLRIRWDESGFGLIEVLASAALLVVMAIGVLAGIDGPAAVSGANKARATASALADQDQDRMRGMKVSDLSNYSARRTVTVDRVPYTVGSATTWVEDASGTDSCTSGSKTADYLQVTSTVSWPSLAGGKPVTVTSIVSPPGAGLGANQGNLVVQLADQANNPVANLPVGLSPAGISVPTNSVGCAFFGHIAAGAVQASFGQSGWVDPAGNSNVTLNGSVTTGTTTTLTDSYAQAAQIVVGFDTKVGSNAPQAAQAQTITIANPALPAPGTRSFGAGGLQASITTTGVFPFSSGYGVYAGNCASADPVSYNPSYWTQGSGFTTPSPGGSSSVTVREPAVNLLVTRSGSPLGGAHVIARATGAGCVEARSLTTNAQGALTSPGLPFGTYTVCADDGTHFFSKPGVVNTNPAGTAAVPLAIPASGIPGRGVCT